MLITFTKVLLRCSIILYSDLKSYQAWNGHLSLLRRICGKKGYTLCYYWLFRLKKNSPFFFVNQPSSNSIASPISRGVSSSPNGLAFETDKIVISPRERIKTQELFISMEYFLIGKSVNT